MTVRFLLLMVISAVNLSMLSPSDAFCSTIWAGSAVPVIADSGPDSAVELGVKFRSDSNGTVSGIRFYKSAGNTGTHTGSLWAVNGTRLATATFSNETASGWQQVNFAAPVVINANTVYVASYHTNSGHYSCDKSFFLGKGIDNPPLHAPADGVSGYNGVFSYGSASSFPNKGWNSSNYWVDVVFNAASGVPLASDKPILIISSSANPFSEYYAEILRTEGLNAFDESDISSLSSAQLAAYDVVILGNISLTTSQVTTLNSWVNGGGRLIAMRPDKKLAGLLGLSDLGTTISDAYLRVNAQSGPGNGIVNQTIQYHGTADIYGLSGATNIATLYFSATTATSNPAVTLRTVGTNGGQAAAFTFDLARSVVYTRQGNPDWAGQDRDGYPPIRSDDLFYGNASFDPNPDWVDQSRIDIPQADEQQRLLANLIIRMNMDKTPLPRFWYFPRNLPAVVVMTGDDHGNGGTAGRFDTYAAMSPSGCSVANWECIRGTSYLFTSTPLSNSQASAYNNAGFELAPHVSTDCSDWTPSTLQSYYSNQVSAWRQKYTGLPSPVSHRTHCVVWSDFTTQPLVELSFGMRLDTTYYYWPPEWVANGAGLFTGSGIPMRFADTNGNLIDVYQGVTQMTDESGQTYPATIDALLDNAVGPEGYYGAFVANMHNDAVASAGADAIIGSAQARGIPIISVRQLLTWLDGRNASTFDSFSRSGNSLDFSVTVGNGASGLMVMLPLADNQTVSRITNNGSSVPFSRSEVKGIDYVRFAAANGSYQVTYTSTGDTAAPTVTGFTIPPTATSLVVPINSFTASDNVAVTGYFVNESTIKPAAAAAGWSSSVPASYAFTTVGNKTLYAWAKDAAGNVSDGRSAAVVITLPSGGTEPGSWYAGDMHVHRSCGGSPEAVTSLYQKMIPNSLAVMSLLADMGNGEVQNPVTDLPLVTGGDAAISAPGRILHWDAEWHWDATYGQYAHQALGGHVLALGLGEAQQVWEEYTYPVLNRARQQNAITGFAHMQYLNNGIPQSLDCCTPLEYPVEVALGSVDFVSEDVDGSDNAMLAYYRLLNCGFRPGLAAGTDYPCNGGANPGSLLTYVQVAGGQMTYRNWIDGIAAGRSVVSRNGQNEFLDLKVNGTATPGDEIKLVGSGSVQVTVQWTANRNLSGTIELVHNGVVVAGKTAAASSGSPATLTTTLNFTRSGWLAARRMDGNGHQLHTAAVFVTVDNAPVRASVEDAQFYVQWIDSLLTNTSPGGAWSSYFVNSRDEAQSRYMAARSLYQQIALEAGGGVTPPPPPPQSSGTIFSSQTPGVYENDAVYELGTRFWSDVNGQVTQVRLYSNALEGGNHTVRIWRASDRTVVSGPHAWNIPSGSVGWKSFQLPSPLSISANTDYIVAVSNSSDRYYAGLLHGFDAPIVNGHLHTYQGSGVYSTQLGGMPTSIWNNTSYFRDVVFVPLN